MIRRIMVALFAVSIAVSPLRAGSETAAECTVRFDGTWSAGTHPTDFPPGAHFSGVIGGTHSDAIAFWAPGGFATAGIQLMAETGGKSLLQGEVEDAILQGSAAAVVSGGDIGTSPGSVSVTFTIDLDHPLLTLVSMIAPSPDWFVGTHGLSLFQQGQWVDGLVIDLPAYDAGTDSGETFLSLDDPTAPPDPIAQINIAPFAGGTSLGTYTIDCTSPLVFIGDFEDGSIDAWSSATP